jgi:hypothetical protein
LACGSFRSVFINSSSFRHTSWPIWLRHVVSVTVIKRRVNNEQRCTWMAKVEQNIRWTERDCNLKWVMGSDWGRSGFAVGQKLCWLSICWTQCFATQWMCHLRDVQEHRFELELWLYHDRIKVREGTVLLNEWLMIDWLIDYHCILKVDAILRGLCL